MALNLTPPNISDDETLSDYLRRRERELIQQTAAIRGMLVPKEKQLEEVRLALKAIGIEPNYVEQLKPFLDQDHPVGALNQSPHQTQTGTPLALLAESLTIKEMILRALNEHFHLGATPSELRDYMFTAYGRTVDRNSISPQLARLRDEGLVQNTNALTGKWEIVLRGSLEEAAAAIERKNSNALLSSNNLPFDQKGDTIPKIDRRGF